MEGGGINQPDTVLRMLQVYKFSCHPNMHCACVKAKINCTICIPGQRCCNAPPQPTTTTTPGVRVCSTVTPLSTQVPGPRQSSRLSLGTNTPTATQPTSEDVDATTTPTTASSAEEEEPLAGNTKGESNSNVLGTTDSWVKADASPLLMEIHNSNMRV